MIIIMSGKSINLLLLMLLVNFDGTVSRPQERKIHGFSLAPVRSDIEKNMVITGVRFAVKDSFICIQMRQGKLLPQGKICLERSWVYEPCNTSSPASGQKLERGGLSEALDVNDIMIDLDDIIGQDNRVLTGIKLGLSDKCPGVQHLHLRLEFTQFNFTSGQLDSDRKSLSSSTCHTNEINPMNLKGNPLVVNPGRRNQLLHQSTSNSFVRFNVANLEEGKMRFLDDLSFESEPMPLTGVGLFYEISGGNYESLAWSFHTRHSDGIAHREIIFDEYAHITTFTEHGDDTRGANDNVNPPCTAEKSWCKRLCIYRPQVSVPVSGIIIIMIIYTFKWICYCLSNSRYVPVRAIPMPAPNNMK